MENCLECPICFEKFNSSENIPLILACGHSLCKKCVIQLGELVCPQDRKLDSRNPNELPKNFALLSVIEANLSPHSTGCKFHSKIFNMHCLTCQTELCEECLNDHFSHEIVRYQDVQSYSQHYIEELKKYYNQSLWYHINCSSELSYLKAKNSELLDSVKAKFSKVRALINIKEREFIKEIKSWSKCEEEVLGRMWTESYQICAYREELLREALSSEYATRLLPDEELCKALIYFKEIFEECKRFEITPVFVDLEHVPNEVHFDSLKIEELIKSIKSPSPEFNPNKKKRMI